MSVKQKEPQARSWPTLYKKTSTGAIQYWTIATDGNEIVTRYGQLGGAEQSTSDLIKEGKNLGKKNETTAEEQAQSEAQSKWEKQKKRGYVETQEQAQAGETEHEGGINPMLAHKYSEQGHKIKYPAYAQPKLDGIRCIAVLSEGRCSLWTRTRKRITGVPHVERQLEHLFPGGSLVLDGELYNHALKRDFEKIVSLVRQEEPASGHEIVEYHVYDIASEGPFKVRSEWLGLHLHTARTTSIKLVQTVAVATEDELMDQFDAFLAQGYEGCMVRNASGDYLNKRSYDLQKVKEFEDAEFPIVGIKEGRGRLQGHVAAFVCQMKSGETFEAKMKGDTGRLKDFFENEKLWKGKQLTVKYQGLTGARGVPRFPVGVAIRDYE